jgi:hypothetical protein
LLLAALGPMLVAMLAFKLLSADIGMFDGCK